MTVHNVIVTPLLMRLPMACHQTLCIIIHDSKLLKLCRCLFQARLRSYLHNPNSAELVHFLFTPLSLLVEASNDPRFDIHDLVGKVSDELDVKNLKAHTLVNLSSTQPQCRTSYVCAG